MGWKQNLVYSVFSRPFADSFKSEIKRVGWRSLCFSPINLARIYHVRKLSDLQLNIGAGGHLAEGWTGIDLMGGSIVRWDVRWGLPFRSSSVKEIHCEHFLEHLQYPDEALRLLKECSRVLGYGGKLRLIVPDAGKYAVAYVQKTASFWRQLKDLGGTKIPFDTEMEIINQAFRMGGDHCFAYDEVTLRNLLRHAGFLKVVTGDFSTSFLDLPDRWRMVESLYICASKAAGVDLDHPSLDNVSIA